MVEIRWTKAARKDLQSIFDYISGDSVFYAKREVAGIYQKALTLQFHIHLGRVVPEFERSNVRELIHKNYRIIYRIRSETRISIIRVHHRSKLLTN